MHPNELKPNTLVEELERRQLVVAEDHETNLQTLLQNISLRGGLDHGITNDLSLAKKKREIEAVANQVQPHAHFGTEMLVESRHFEQVVGTLSDFDDELVSTSDGKDGPFRVIIKGRHSDVARLRETFIQRQSELVTDEIIYVIPTGLAPKLSSTVLLQMKQTSLAKYHLYKLKGSDTYLLVIQGSKEERNNACKLLEETFADAFTKEEFSKTRKKRKHNGNSGENGFTTIFNDNDLQPTKKKLMISLYCDPTTRDLVIQDSTVLNKIAEETKTVIRTVHDDPSFFKSFEVNISGYEKQVERARVRFDAICSELKSRTTCLYMPFRQYMALNSNNSWDTLRDYTSKNYNVTLVATRDGNNSLIHILGETSNRIAAMKVLDYQLFRSDYVNQQSKQDSLSNMRQRMKELDFREYGIGGLNDKLKVMLRRTFASRLISEQLRMEMGVSHTKGVLLYGPPGTGKSLVARKISGILGCEEPKIVNSPEIESKWVGEAEKNIRALFEDAVKDHKELGHNSPLHVVIFDELDAIAKRRGGAHAKSRDGALNQLLCSLDGINEISNLLVFGLTNRMDALDPALLRPGRLEVQLDIPLPDAKGRFEILEIHTKAMRKYDRIDLDVDLNSLASFSDGFSGADLHGFIRNAQAFALEDFRTEEECVVTQEHLETALEECRLQKLNQPAFGEEPAEPEGISLA